MASRDAPIDVERFRDRTGIGTDDAYRLLADARVRTTLRVLREEGVVPVERLTEAIVRTEDRQRADAVRLELVHATLPKLEDHGLLTRDHGSGRMAVERALDAKVFAEAVATPD